MPPRASSSISRLSAAATTSTAESEPPPHEITDEMCPVCKSLRYLNKHLRFLISPECYHPMCTTCVARIFESGPAQCPYPTCHKTLRKKQFREAFFGNLDIERECDVRKRVATVFNKRETDFEGTKEFNDYLEMVECLVFDLVSGNEALRNEAQGKLMDWERQHKEEIEKIRRARGNDIELRRLRMEQEREEHRRRKEMMAQEDLEEKRIKDGYMNEVIDALANSTTTEQGEKEVGRIILKKRGRAFGAAGGGTPAATTAAGRGPNAAKSALSSSFQPSRAGTPGALSDTASGIQSATAALSIRGLKKHTSHADRRRALEQMEGVYSPFQRLRLAPSRYPSLEDKGVYHHLDIEAYLTMNEYKVPGYSSAEFYKRAVFGAFSGLAVFIGENDEEDDAGGEKEKKGNGEGGGREGTDAMEIDW